MWGRAGRGQGRAIGMGTNGFPTDRSTRDTDFGAPASLPHVMPGTSPLLSGLEFRHGFRAHGRAHLRAPCCHPGLVPGSRTPRKPAHSSRICVYGGAGPRNKSGVTIGTGAPCAGVPQCVSRVERSVGNPLVTRPHSQPMKVKPDSSGTSPGMTAKGECRRTPTPPGLVPDHRRGASQRLNRTAVDLIRGAGPPAPCGRGDIHGLSRGGGFRTMLGRASARKRVRRLVHSTPVIYIFY